MPVVCPPVTNGPPFPPQIGYVSPPPVGMHAGFVPQPAFFTPQGPGPMGPMVPLGPHGHQMTTPVPTPMSFHDQAKMAQKHRDYEALSQIIKQWNANRLDLFALSLPNEVSLFSRHKNVRRGRKYEDAENSDSVGSFYLPSSESVRLLFHFLLW